MDTVPIGISLLLLFALIILSAFFSSSETGMMSINRYRLKHKARKNKKHAANRVKKMLERPDRLLGVILIGNNFSNILATSIATAIAIHYWGDVGVIIASIALTLVILIFSEIAPKTLAAIYPERIAYTASLPLSLLLKLLYPLVWLATKVSNGLLMLLGFKLKPKIITDVSREELRTLVYETDSGVSQKHQNMLLGILDLGEAYVEDIIVPEPEIVGIDLNDDWEDILSQLTLAQHTRIPIYEGDINNIVGVLHVRRALNLIADNKLTRKSLRKIITSAYFVPESTPLSTLLVNFQLDKRRLGFVVDEYGDVIGLVTLEDILEEIVGEFTTNFTTVQHEISPQADGSYIVEGSIVLRKLNRLMNWDLPTDAAKTLSGLVVDYLEDIPRAKTSVRVKNYIIEIVQVKANVIKTLRVKPLPKEKTDTDENV